MVLKPCKKGEFLMYYFGPRDKNNEITDAEELQIVEAFAEAEEYLETSMVDDYYFDTED